MLSIRKLQMDEQEQNSHFIEGHGCRDSDAQSSPMWGRQKDAVAHTHEACCPDGKGLQERISFGSAWECIFSPEHSNMNSYDFLPLTWGTPYFILKSKKFLQFPSSRTTACAKLPLQDSGEHRHSGIIKFLRIEIANFSDFTKMMGGGLTQLVQNGILNYNLLKCQNF